MKPIRSVFVLAGLVCVMVGAPLRGIDARDAEFLGAISRGDVAAVKKALATGLNPEVRADDGLTALIVAVKNERLEVVRTLLASGANVLTRSGKGSPPLGFAAQTGNMEIIRHLMEKGAELEARADTGDTPLTSAAKFGRLDAVRYFLDAGAGIDNPGPRDKNKHEATALWVAAVMGKMDVVKLLLERGAEINAPAHEDTVVMEVAKTDNAEMLRYLIAHGANIHHRAGQSREALMYAAYNGRVENIRILLAAGAKARQDDLDEANFPPDSEGYKLLSDAIARNTPEPAPRTAKDVEGLRRKEVSADMKYPAGSYKF